MYTLQDVQNDLIAKLGGTTINRVRNFFGTADQAGKNLLARIDPKETKQIAQLVQPFYDKVYDYFLPLDLKDDALADIRPILVQGRPRGDHIIGTYAQQFDVKKLYNSFSIRYNNGIRTLRIKKRLSAPVTMFTFNSLTQEGTVVAGGDVQNLTVDNNFFLTGNGAFKFDLDGTTGQGFIEIFRNSETDLTQLLDVGAFFLYQYFNQNFAQFNSLELRWGSDALNYWSKTTSVQQINTAFQQFWNLLRFDWATAVKTGTPDVTKVKYLRIAINYTAGTPQLGLFMENLTAQLGTPFEIEYYSQYLYRDATGVWKEKPTALTDVINLATTSYNIYLFELCKLILQQVKTIPGAASFDLSLFMNELDGSPGRQGREGKRGLYDQYAEQFPTERMTFSTNYYDFGYFDTDGEDSFDGFRDDVN